MPFIDWQSSFELGIENFDDHHGHLVSLINKIYDDYTAEAPSQVLGSVLEELIDYASYHFLIEETWMDNKNYPKLEQHSAEHDKFRATMIGFKRDYNEGKLNISLDLLMFLKSWLIDHILKTDSEYRVCMAPRVVGLGTDIV